MNDLVKFCGASVLILDCTVEPGLWFPWPCFEVFLGIWNTVLLMERLLFQWGCFLHDEMCF